MMKILHIGVYTPENGEAGSRLFYLIKALNGLSRGHSHAVVSIEKRTNGDNGINPVKEYPVIVKMRERRANHFESIAHYLGDDGLSEIELIHIYMGIFDSSNGSYDPFGVLGRGEFSPLYGQKHKPVVTTLPDKKQLDSLDNIGWKNIETVVEGSRKIILPGEMEKLILTERLGNHDKIDVINGSKANFGGDQKQVRETIWRKKADKYMRLFGGLA